MADVKLVLSYAVLYVRLHVWLPWLVGTIFSLVVFFRVGCHRIVLYRLQHLQLLAVVKGVRAKDVDDEAARMVSYERPYGQW